MASRPKVGREVRTKMAVFTRNSSTSIIAYDIPRLDTHLTDFLQQSYCQCSGSWRDDGTTDASFNFVERTTINDGKITKSQRKGLDHDASNYFHFFLWSDKTCPIPTRSYHSLTVTPLANEVHQTKRSTGQPGSQKVGPCFISSIVALIQYSVSRI